MVTAGDPADDRSSFPVKGQAPSQTNFKAPANKIEKRQLDNLSHRLHLTARTSVCAATSWRDADRHLRHDFPFG
jgi:hypothetical protein